MFIVSRKDWGADPASLPHRSMRLPATELWIHHTVTEPTINPAADMRVIERIGLKRFGVFSYSYCVHPNGDVLEGAGLRRGAHTEKRNSTSFGVAWIGNYQNDIPTPEAIEATRHLTWWLQEKGHLRPEVYPTGGHRDLKTTACPGDNLYRILDDLREPWFPPPQVPEGVDVANAPFAAILIHPDGGYLEIGTDGGVFAYGGAPFFGSLGDQELNAPIVDAAWAPDHKGYYLQGRDGGVFAFGSARHVGNAFFPG